MPVKRLREIAERLLELKLKILGQVQFDRSGNVVLA